MPTNPITLSSNDDVYWMQASRVLGSERCSPLLNLLGLPSDISDRPAHLQSIFQDIWWAYVQGPGSVRSSTPSTDTDAENHDFDTHVRRAFRSLAAAYGANDADALYVWVMRHFVDIGEGNRCRQWFAILRSLGDTLARGSDLQHPLDRLAGPNQA